MAETRRATRTGNSRETYCADRKMDAFVTGFSDHFRSSKSLNHVATLYHVITLLMYYLCIIIHK
jgi:hypothetical protein